MTHFVERTATVALVGLLAVAAWAGPTGTAFNYQGRLELNGQPANGVYDFQCRLYGGQTTLIVLAGPVQISDVPVNDGVFTMAIDFGSQFYGDERWLSVAVRPAGGGAYTTLSPRQELKPTPNAVSAQRLVLPFSGVGNTTTGDLFTTHVFDVSQAGNAAAIHGAATNNGTGVMGEATGATATGVVGTHAANTGFVSAIYGETHSTSGRGVYGHNTAPSGSSAFGVQGMSESVSAGAAGVRGVANGGGTALTYGVRGETTSTGGAGVCGYGGKYGVYGLATDGEFDSVGVLGITSDPNGTGVTGRAGAGGSKAAGILGQAPFGGWAGFFEGNVYVTGTLSGPDKAFLIDNPANPENEYLQHAVVESDERRNLYDGVVTLDATGAATVALPDWFEALNGDFRYQLTCVGGYAPVYVASEIRGGRFTIAGGQAGLRVSWQVTGVRVDAFAAAHPFRAVKPKAADERGKFLDAAAFGATEAAQISRFANVWPDMVRAIPSEVTPESAAPTRNANTEEK